MSGGQHNPNGRQAQLGSAWNHLQVPYLGRVPQAAHMSSERAGVTWHTPTPPPPPSHHPYLAPPPASISPDPLQVLKVGAGGNTVFRHTPTPPDRDSAMLYRHTPTPPDKLYRHTPSPGDPKVGAVLPPADIYPMPLHPRDKLRAEELLAYARVGVDLTLGRPPPANGAPLSLSVRDAPTINSLISAATARPQHAPRPAHARVDALLERLAPAPHSPHSVIVHPRAAPSPSPPDSNEDSTDSCGAPHGGKRKRKPERTVRVPAPRAPPLPHTPTPPPRAPSPAPLRTQPAPPPTVPDAASRVAPAPDSKPKSSPLENGDGPHEATDTPPSPGLPHARRKTKSETAETIDEIAAMIASTDRVDGSASADNAPPIPKPPEPDEPPATIEVLKKVLGSPGVENDPLPPKPTPLPPSTPLSTEEPPKEVPVKPKRRSTRSSHSDTSSVQEATTSDARPAEKAPVVEEKKSEAVPNFVEVENQLEQMFAGIEEEAPPAKDDNPVVKSGGAKKRQRSRTGRKPAQGKGSRRSSGAASTGDDNAAPKAKIARKKSTAPSGRKREANAKEVTHRDAYDSGSNASSGRSRGPYVQIRGPRDSPLYVNVVNAATGEDDCDGAAARQRPARRKGSADGDFRNGLKTRGLHCSTLSLRYDATTPDVSWVCAFCELGPHAGVKDRLEGPVRPLGDLFGPYTISTDCEEYRALDEQRRRWHAGPLEEKDTREVWFHEECGLWAPGLVAAGARLSGLEGAVWTARAARCGRCGRAGAGVPCAARACPARAHVNCARATLWQLHEDDFRAFCPRHARA